MKDNKTLQSLPEEIQSEVLENLKAWTGCYVFRNDITGKLSVGIGIGITKDYNPERCIAAFRAHDIYTPEEIAKYAAEVWGGCEMY